jgi:hypothetical protein
MVILQVSTAFVDGIAVEHLPGAIFRTWVVRRTHRPATRSWTNSENGVETPFVINAGSDLPEHKRMAQEKGAQGSTNSPQELLDLVVRAIVSPVELSQAQELDHAA